MSVKYERPSSEPDGVKESISASVTHVVADAWPLSSVRKDMDGVWCRDIADIQEVIMLSLYAHTFIASTGKGLAAVAAPAADLRTCSILARHAADRQSPHGLSHRVMYGII